MFLLIKHESKNKFYMLNEIVFIIQTYTIEITIRSYATDLNLGIHQLVIQSSSMHLFEVNLLLLIFNKFC